MPSIVSIAQDGQYIGLKVKSVLQVVGRPHDDHLFVDHEPGILSGAAFHFEGEGWLYFYVDACAHQPAENAERKWDLQLFLLEKVDGMEWEED